MNVKLLAPLLIAVSLAGCAASDEPIDSSTDETRQGDGVAYSGPYVGSHPAYGYPTYGFADASYEGWSDAWTPPAATDLPEALGLEHVTHVSGITPNDGGTTGAGIAIWGHYAYVGDAGGPTNVVDIQDPLAPVVVAVIDVPIRDAETIAYPDGQVVLVTSDGGEVWISDITDPTQPQVIVEEMNVTGGAHNVAVLPGTPIYYNSASGGNTTDIWDLTNPAEPMLIEAWENGAGCHDIMWYIDQASETYRGYCAGIGETQIWDVTDPVRPRIIATMPLPESTPLSISHLAIVNHDASVLIVGDETGGGVAPACDYYTENPATGETDSGPSGNLWFYDLSDETEPVYTSRISVSAPDSHATCTSHFGRIVEETNTIVIAFYGAGVVTIDFNDLANPRIVDQWRPESADGAPPGLVWDAWYYEGYVFTGDLTRGMDVLRFVEPPLI